MNGGKVHEPIARTTGNGSPDSPEPKGGRGSVCGIPRACVCCFRQSEFGSRVDA